MRELAGYRSQWPDPISSWCTLDELVEEAFARKSEEVKASHILVQVGADASPADTLMAWNRIQGLRSRVLNGEDFETVARSKNGSGDASVTTNGGDLGWFLLFKWCIA